MPAFKHRFRGGEFHLHVMRQLVAGILEKCVDCRDLAAPEVFTIPAEVCEQSVGLLYEGRENSFLNLDAVDGMNNAVA